MSYVMYIHAIIPSLILFDLVVVRIEVYILVYSSIYKHIQAHTI
jgi:hypothetical protein